MVFSKDVGAAFDPTDLGENVTPSAARMALREGDARRALLMALRLRGAEDDDALLAETLETTPVDAVAAALRDFPAALFAPLLEAIARRVASGPHAQLMLTWTRELCVAHGRALHQAAHGGLTVGGALVGGEAARAARARARRRGSCQRCGGSRRRSRGCMMTSPPPRRPPCSCWTTCARRRP